VVLFDRVGEAPANAALSEPLRPIAISAKIPVDLNCFIMPVAMGMSLRPKSLLTIPFFGGVAE
jgi:hypothetical protein